MDKMEQDNGEIGKEPDKTNPEDLPEYIQPFIHLFNKKKFEKLPKRHEWDHEINLMDEAPKELNAKAYAMTLKEEEALNQWLDEQLKARLIVESKSRYAAPYFYIPKKDGLLRLVQDYRKLNQVTIKDKTPLPLIGCHMQVHLSGKLHPRGDVTSKKYKPAFHGSYLSRNTSYGGAATLRIFHLPWRKYSYSTQSSMTELLLSVSQH